DVRQDRVVERQLPVGPLSPARAVRGLRRSGPFGRLAVEERPLVAPPAVVDAIDATVQPHNRTVDVERRAALRCSALDADRPPSLADPRGLTARKRPEPEPELLDLQGNRRQRPPEDRTDIRVERLLEPGGDALGIVPRRCFGPAEHLE